MRAGTLGKAPQSIAMVDGECRLALVALQSPAKPWRASKAVAGTMEVTSSRPPSADAFVGGNCVPQRQLIMRAGTLGELRKALSLVG